MKYFIFILLLLSSYSFSFAKTCDREQTLKSYHQSFENLNLQKQQVQAVLKGEVVEEFSPSILFGHDFSLDQTESKIVSLNKVKVEKQSISLEHETLYQCLEELKLNKRAQNFQNLSAEVLDLKIEFLLRNKKLGDTLRNKESGENSLPGLREKLDQDNSETRQLKKELEIKLIENTSESSKEKSVVKRESLSFKNELTRIKIELLDARLTANKALENRIKVFEGYNTKLLELASEIKKSAKLESNFFLVEDLWLKLAKENYYDIIFKENSLNLPAIPNFPKGENFQTEEIKEIYQELQVLKVEILKGHTQKKTQEIKLLNKLVTNSNSIRASYYQELGHGYFFGSLGDLKSYMLLKNEVTAAPLRVLSYVYKKYLYIAEKIKLGKEGYVDIFGHLIVLVLLVVLFFTLKIVFARTEDKLDSWFRSIFKALPNLFILRKAYSFWVKMKEITVPCLWYGVLGVLEDIEYFDDVYLVIELLQVFLGGQILQVLVTKFLGAVSRLDTGNFQVFKKKASETSIRFKNIYLFYFTALILIEVTVGKVYLYTVVYYIVLFYSLIQFVKESARWESEFIKYAEKRFSGVLVEGYGRLTNFLPKKFNAALFLIFIWVLQVFNLFVSLTENLEISKKISANLFKKQIEKVEADSEQENLIPESYKELFSPRSIETDEEYVENGYKIEEKVLAEIDEWREGKNDEHSLVLFGDKGIGKTTLLKKVERELGAKEDIATIYCKVPSKLTQKADLYKFLGELLGDQDENFDIYRTDKRLERRTVVILDEAQNVYLSQTGGFDAYYGLMNILNMNTDNIYWIMSFNKYSWLYLDRAFGRTKFVRNVFEVQGWSDTKIKELIVKRHEKSHFRLSYDLLINATRSQDEIDRYASVESKFFKLIWELSRGNPRAALFLWKSALSRKSTHSLNVNVPRAIELDGIEKLPDDLLFVIAEVLKHENLSTSEIERTTNLQKGIVRYALKLGLERKYFFKDERNRYMIEISTQYGLIKYLRLKNFIYGS